MQQESKLLIGALRKAVAGQPAQLPTDVDWTRFYRLTKAHNVCALAWHGLREVPEVVESMPPELQNQFSTEYLQTIFRDFQLEQVKNKLQQGLQEAQVPHIFLKGASLKYNYPVPALRTMCDIDILVRTEDYKKIDAVAASLQAEQCFGDGNHHNFKFPGGVMVECHPNLVHPGTLYGTELNPGWQYMKADSDPFTKEMTPEGVYLHTITHLAEHFSHGGVGVRFVLDIWVCRNLSKEQYDRDFVATELKRLSLLDFAQKIEALAEVWFGDGEQTPVLAELEEYILTSGSHGTSHRAMLNAVSLSPGGNQVSALWHKVFYPREELETRFPWAKGKPWLLPAAWCVRAYGAVTKRGHLIRKWSRGTGNMSKEEIVRQQEKLARFGIEKRK